MPGLDGFGVIKKLLDRKVALPKIIFATAFDQYAVKAFEVNAIDYILKPFDKKRVAQSVDKARAKIEGGAGSDEKFETLVRMLESQKSQTAKILIKAAGRLFLADRRTSATRPSTMVSSQWSPAATPAWKANPTAALWKNSTRISIPACSAGAPVVPGEHPSHPRGGAVVQELVPAPHGRQETDGNPRQRAQTADCGSSSICRKKTKKMGGLERAERPPQGRKSYEAIACNAMRFEITSVEPSSRINSLRFISLSNRVPFLATIQSFAQFLHA